MRFSNFVKFTGPEARGPGKGVPIGAGIKMGRGSLIFFASASVFVSECFFTREKLLVWGVGSGL